MCCWGNTNRMRHSSTVSVSLRVLTALLLVSSSSASLATYTCAHSGRSIHVVLNAPGNESSDMGDMPCCRNMPPRVFEKLCMNASCNNGDQNESATSSLPKEPPYSHPKTSVDNSCEGCSSEDVSPEIAANSRGPDSVVILVTTIATAHDYTQASHSYSNTHSHFSQQLPGPSPSRQVLYSSFLI